MNIDKNVQLRVAACQEKIFAKIIPQSWRQEKKAVVPVWPELARDKSRRSPRNLRASCLREKRAQSPIIPGCSQSVAQASRRCRRRLKPAATATKIDV